MKFSDYFIGGCASVGATAFTNPIEVVKTRLQLQGELAAKGTYVQPYKGVGRAFLAIIKNDGFAALQKGLVPALYFQFIINFFRLGIYNTALDLKWIHTKDGGISMPKALLCGGTGGAIGAYLSSPFYMVKTQLQSKAAKEIAVGYQHKHTSMTASLKAIYKQNGIRGLYRGADSTIPRAALGSGAQIATFGVTKEFLRSRDLVVNPIANSFVAGAIAGSVMSLAITPPDVITTRILNQGVDVNGKGLLYKNYLDCLLKVVKIEGLFGLYKGFWPNYMRIGPHSTLGFFEL